MSVSINQHKLLFNFAASYTYGGYKRLVEYARWFDAVGGAAFVVHKNCWHLREQFPGNRYYVVEQSRLRRLFDDCNYLRSIEDDIGRPDLYYSYGIPLYYPFGTINWFHLSNVLTLKTSGAPMSPRDIFRFGYLGWRIKRGLPHADIISAESRSSLEVIERKDSGRLFLSVNGSDEELSLVNSGKYDAAEDIVAVVGTYRYKGLPDAVRVFEMLKSEQRGLQLLIFGREDLIPARLRSKPNVVAVGNVSRASLIDVLRRSKYYVSTTYAENASNANSEGVFCAAESYISDIGPHRELLQGMPFDRVRVPGLSRDLLHVKRGNLSGGNLKTWDTVIVEMMARFNAALAERRASQ